MHFEKILDLAPTPGHGIIIRLTISARAILLYISLLGDIDILDTVNLFFSVMLASVLLYWHWEAMLISYLATRVIVLPFNNIDELVKTSSFKIALNPGSSYEGTFIYYVIHKLILGGRVATGKYF